MLCATQMITRKPNRCRLYLRKLQFWSLTAEGGITLLSQGMQANANGLHPSTEATLQDAKRELNIPRAVLILRKLDNVIDKLVQLGVGQSVVAEVIQQLAAAVRHHQILARRSAKTKNRRCCYYSTFLTRNPGLRMSNLPRLRQSFTRKNVLHICSTNSVYWEYNPFPMHKGPPSHFTWFWSVEKASCPNFQKCPTTCKNRFCTSFRHQAQRKTYDWCCLLNTRLAQSAQTLKQQRSAVQLMWKLYCLD